MIIRKYEQRGTNAPVTIHVTGRHIVTITSTTPSASGRYSNIGPVTYINNSPIEVKLNGGTTMMITMKRTTNDETSIDVESTGSHTDSSLSGIGRTEFSQRHVRNHERNRETVIGGADTIRLFRDVPETPQQWTDKPNMWRWAHRNQLSHLEVVAYMKGLERPTHGMRFNTLVFLDVPYDMNELVKKLGGLWCESIGFWAAPWGADLIPFIKLPEVQVSNGINAWERFRMRGTPLLLGGEEPRVIGHIMDLTMDTESETGSDDVGDSGEGGEDSTEASSTTESESESSSDTSGGDGQGRGYTSGPESSASANRPNTKGANVQQVRQQHVVTVTPPRSSRSDTEQVQATAQQETRTMPHKQGTSTHEHQENSAAAAAAPAGPPNDDNQSYNFSSDDNDSDLVRALEESLALAREKERANKKRMRDIDKKRPALNENMLKKPPHGNQAMEKTQAEARATDRARDGSKHPSGHDKRKQPSKQKAVPTYISTTPSSLRFKSPYPPGNTPRFLRNTNAQEASSESEMSGPDQYEQDSFCSVDYRSNSSDSYQPAEARGATLQDTEDEEEQSDADESTEDQQEEIPDDDVPPAIAPPEDNVGDDTSNAAAYAAQENYPADSEDYYSSSEDAEENGDRETEDSTGTDNNDPMDEGSEEAEFEDDFSQNDYNSSETDDSSEEVVPQLDTNSRRTKRKVQKTITDCAPYACSRDE